MAGMPVHWSAAAAPGEATTSSTYTYDDSAQHARPRQASARSPAVVAIEHGRKPSAADEDHAVVAVAGVAAESASKPIYRGVARDHPGYDDALNGNAYPRNPNGLTSAEAHNAGAADDLADSPFTSWTHSLDVARTHARGDGAILQWRTGAPPPGASWKFEWSPDVWHEQEVLIRGAIEGARVLP